MFGCDMSRFSVRCRFRHAAMKDDTPSWSFPPPIPAIDITKGHPKPSMMGVIVSLSFHTRIERVAPGHSLLIRTDDRPQYRLGTGTKPIGSQQRFLVQDIDPVILRLHRVLGARGRCPHRAERQQNQMKPYGSGKG
jgi:hypothetical protein